MKTWQVQVKKKKKKILLIALFSDKPEVFLPKYSQTAILHAAHFRRVVNYLFTGALSWLPMLGKMTLSGRYFLRSEVR